MKLYKYIFSFIITLLISLMFINLNKFNANTSDNGKASWTPKTEEVQDIYGTKHLKAYGTTTSTRYSSDGNQMINLLEMKTDGINSKLVAWAIQSGNDKYGRAGLTYIAEDYEKTHPGWIVTAGVNGDQYFQYFGSDLYTSGAFFYSPQPYYPLFMDGERRFAASPTGNYSNFIGISNNKYNEPFIYPTSTNNAAEIFSGLKLEILDNDGNILSIYDVDNINSSPTSGKISVWFPYNNEESNGICNPIEVNSSSKLYIIEDPELAYMSNSRTYSVGSKEDIVFGRGTVSEIFDSYTFNRFTFGIEGDGLESILTKGTRVRVQLHYIDDKLNNIESAFGYHSLQRKGNADVESTAPYNTNRYNRSIFGRKADGTYVLMTVARGLVNNGNFTGTDHDESNAILKNYGVVEAYQQDGGGSVTAIVRTPTGSFDIVNESNDSGVRQRNVISGCFFVVRDPGYACYGKDSTRTSITLSKINDYNKDVISNIYAECNNKKFYPGENGNIVINDLNEDTEYDVKLYYTINSVERYINLKGSTAKYVPPRHGIELIDINATSATIEYVSTYYSKYISTKASILLAGQTEVLQSIDLKQFGDKYTFNNLNRNTNYLIKVEYVVHDELLNKDMNCEDYLEFTTININKPLIKSLTATNIDNKNLKLNFDIDDSDKQIEAIFIEYRPVSQEKYISMYAERDARTYEISDIDLATGDFAVRLNVKYSSGKSMISDEIMVSYDETLNKQETPTKKKCGKKSIVLVELLSCISLLYFILKKNKNL